MPKITVFPDVATPGWDGPGDDGEGVEFWEVWDLELALAEQFSNDAHFAPYHLAGEDHCPRLNTRAFEAADPVYDLVVWDVDAKHQSWGEAGDHSGLVSRVPSWIGWYSTRGGWRLWVEPGTLTWGEYAGMWEAGRAYLAERGVVVDSRTSDITRVYRLPRVRRDGVMLQGVVHPPSGRCLLESSSAAPASSGRWSGSFAGADELPSEGVAVPPVLGEGERNDGLFRIGCHLKEKGFPQATIELALVDLAKRVCDPPMAESEALLVASSVDRYEMGTLSLLALARPGEGMVLRSGSEAEVADIILRGLEDGSSHEVVAVDGELWRWSGTEWQRADDAFRREVLSLDGATVGKRRLHVSKRLIEGAHGIALMDRKRLGFFKPGMVIDGKVAGTGRDVAAVDRLRWSIPGPVGGRRDALEEVLGRQFGDLDDGRARLLQEFCGACLYGEAWRYQRALVLLGSGANGKSAFLEALAACFPAGAVAAVGPHHWSGYHLASLAGCYLNYCLELPDQRLSDTATFKAVVAGDPVPARRIYKDPIILEPRAGHIFSANDLPPASDLPMGFWRRWLVLEWPNVIPEAERDVDFVNRLKEERGAMLEWLIEGADRLRARGHYLIPDEVEGRAKEWKEEADVVVVWLREQRWSPRCRWEPGEQLDNATLYDAFRSWAVAAGVKNLPNRVWFSRKLGKHLEKWRSSSERGYIW